MKRFLFIRTNGEWYIDLPEYLLLGGKQEDLQMVAGADEVLDKYAENAATVSLFIDIKPFETADHLELLSYEPLELENGAYYRLNSLNGRKSDQTVWLCQVILFVFDEIPKDIYILKVKEC